MTIIDHKGHVNDSFTVFGGKIFLMIRSKTLPSVL